MSSLAKAVLSSGTLYSLLAASSTCMPQSCASEAPRRFKPSRLPFAMRANPQWDSRSAHSSKGSWLPATTGGAAGKAAGAGTPPGMSVLCAAKDR